MLDRSAIEKLIDLVNEQTARLKQHDEIHWAEVAEWDHITHDLQKELKGDGVRIEYDGEDYELIGSGVGKSAWIKVDGVSVRLNRHNPLLLRIEVYPFEQEDGKPVSCDDDGSPAKLTVNCGAKGTPVRLNDGTESQIDSVDYFDFEFPYYANNNWYGARELLMIQKR